MRPDIPLRTVVQCDFDDTIIIGNMSHCLLQAFASGDWRAIDARYQRGQLTVERSNQLQWISVRASPARLRAFVLSRARVREGFSEFANYCRTSGIRLVVVSSGLDAYVDTVLASIGLDDVERYCGKALFTPDGIDVRYYDPVGEDLHEGFKLACQQYLRPSAGHLVYVGDGASDVAPALRADLVLARSALAEELQARSHPFVRFETFERVTRTLANYQGSAR